MCMIGMISDPEERIALVFLHLRAWVSGEQHDTIDGMLNNGSAEKNDTA